jgi:hypothetical protein
VCDWISKSKMPKDKMSKKETSNSFDPSWQPLPGARCLPNGLGTHRRG